MESFAEIRKIAWRTIAEFLGITEPTNVLGGAAVGKYLRGDATWKEDIDVFLIGGQSNAVGHGSSASSPSVPTGKVLQINSGTITDANDPVGTANTGSAWPSFGLTYYNATGRKICFVPKAVDSSAQAVENDTGQGNWDASGALYGASVTALNTALTDLAAANYNPVFRGVLWGQAETDALVGADKTKYQPALAAMLVRYRSTYGATMPFYIFQVGTDDPITAGFATIRAAQESLAASDKYTRIVYKNAQFFIDRSLMADQYHYTQAGYNEMGRVGAAHVVSGRTSVAMAGETDGIWVTPAFASGNFTANGSMTWTVAAGDVTTYAYTVTNKVMTLQFALGSTTVGGTLNNNLRIAVPAGKTITKSMTGFASVAQGGTPAAAVCYAIAGNAYVYVETYTGNYGASTDATDVTGSITFEIA